MLKLLYPSLEIINFDEITIYRNWKTKNDVYIQVNNKPYLISPKIKYYKGYKNINSVNNIADQEELKSYIRDVIAKKIYLYIEVYKHKIIDMSETIEELDDFDCEIYKLDDGERYLYHSNYGILNYYFNALEPHLCVNNSYTVEIKEIFDMSADEFEELINKYNIWKYIREYYVNEIYKKLLLSTLYSVFNICKTYGANKLKSLINEVVLHINEPPKVIKTNKAIYVLSDNMSIVNSKKIIRNFNPIDNESKQFIDNDTLIYRAYTKVDKTKYKSIGIIIVKNNNEYLYLKKEESKTT